MTKIKKMEMAPAIANNSHITIRHHLFGLVESAVYNPTESPVKGATFEYTVHNGEQLSKLLDCQPLELDSRMQPACPIRHIPVGNIRAEVCYSADHQFLAILLLQFINFEYRPRGEVRILTGTEAEAASRLFPI
ncbi:MAG: hypothetical protein SPF39_01835 [Prevotella sp.]|nr:hypothetical protein [Prevotella sp.]